MYIETMASNTRLVSSRGCFALTPIVGSVGARDDPQLLFVEDHECSTFSVSPPHSAVHSTTSIPGVQETFQKISPRTHPSPTLATALNRCCGPGHIGFSAMGFTTPTNTGSSQTTPGSLYSDSLHPLDSHHTLDSSFETSSSSAIDLSDFPSTLMNSTLSEFNSFSCDPASSCNSSPSDARFIGHNSSLRDGASLPLCSPCCLPMDEDEDTDIVPNELVQFVSESTLRIQGELADGASVVDGSSDIIDDMDHEARLASLCLPILQPPSLISSRVSDSSMRPPSLSPEPTVDNSSDFPDTTVFSKAYFREVPEVHDSYSKSLQHVLPISDNLDCVSVSNDDDDDPICLESLDLIASSASLSSQVISSHCGGLSQTNTAGNHAVPIVSNRQISGMDTYESITSNTYTFPYVTQNSGSTPHMIALTTVTSPSTTSYSPVSIGGSFKHPAVVEERNEATEKLPLGRATIGLPSNTPYGQCSTSAVSESHVNPLSGNHALLCLPHVLGGSSVSGFPSAHQNGIVRCFAAANETSTHVCLSKKASFTDNLNKVNLQHSQTDLISSQGNECSETVIIYPHENPNKNTPTASLVFESAISTAVSRLINNQGLPQMPPSASTEETVSSAPIQWSSPMGLLSTSANGYCSSNVLASGLNLSQFSNGTKNFICKTSDIQIFPQLQSNLTTISSSNLSGSTCATPISLILPATYRSPNQIILPATPRAPNSEPLQNNLTLQLLNSLPALRPGTSILLNVKNNAVSGRTESGQETTIASALTDTAGTIKPNNALFILPGVGPVVSSRATVPGLSGTPFPSQQHLGILSSTWSAPLVVVTTTSNSYSNSLSLSNCSTSMHLNTATMTSNSQIPFPLTAAHFLLLRATPKTNVKLESPDRIATFDSGCSTATLGLTPLPNPSVSQKSASSDSANLLFIPSLPPLSTSDTSLTFSIPTSADLQLPSRISSEVIASNQSFITYSQNTGQYNGTGVIPGLSGVNFGLDPSCSTLLASSASPALHRPISVASVNQTAFPFPLTLLPGINSQTIMLPATWSASTANFLTSSVQHTVKQAILSPVSTLAASIPFDVTTPSSVPISTSDASESTTSTNTPNITPLLYPVYSMSSCTNTLSSVALTTGADHGEAERPINSHVLCKKPIVLPSADKLLSTRPSVILSTVNSLSPTSSKSSDPCCLTPCFPISASSSSTSAQTSESVSETPTAVTIALSGSVRRRHQCPYCPKSCERKDNLQAHIRTHTGERPYPCRFCPKAFPQKDHLRAHIRTHTGEKPYRCPQCLKAFAQLGNLHRHVKTHRR
ncbi:hypothetical protein EG68_01998 [Paragonimus skrjabini miyazakii]|uniref:C2H2-type domain-containing protein n=1 Tax=Paragonimus skrjabini miyazakii TaxID=59628 RepID=A0A8S9Z4E6_9TREM|nr:hypothetical protein EG68_01998 [Paragonimus skrjabini miyazakii]